MKNADQYVSDIQKSLQTLLQNIQPEMVESMAKHEVTPAQLFVLASLKKHGSCKVSEIAERMEVKPSAVTLMADRLEQKDLSSANITSRTDASSTSASPKRRNKIRRCCGRTESDTGA